MQIFAARKEPKLVLHALRQGRPLFHTFFLPLAQVYQRFVLNAAAILKVWSLVPRSLPPFSSDRKRHTRRAALSIGQQCQGGATAIRVHREWRAMSIVSLNFPFRPFPFAAKPSLLPQKCEKPQQQPASPSISDTGPNSYRFRAELSRYSCDTARFSQTNYRPTYSDARSIYQFSQKVDKLYKNRQYCQNSSSQPILRHDETRFGKPYFTSFQCKNDRRVL